MLRPILSILMAWIYFLGYTTSIGGEADLAEEFPFTRIAERHLEMDRDGFDDPVDIALSADGKNLLILFPRALYKVDLGTFDIAASYRIHFEKGKALLSVAMSPDCKTILVYQMPDTVLILNADDLSLARRINIGTSDYRARILVDQHSRHGYALRDQGFISVFDITTGSVMEQVKLPSTNPSRFTLSEDDPPTAYVTFRNQGTVSVWNSAAKNTRLIPITPEKSRTVSSGSFSFKVNLADIELDPKGRYLYLQSLGGSQGDQVLIFNIKDSNIVKQINAGVGASRLQTGFQGNYLLLRDTRRFEQGTFSTVVNCNDFRGCIA